MADVVVSVSDLRTALDAVLAAVERERGDVIAVPVDHYWTLDSRAKFRLYEPAPAPNVGQVSDDAESLRVFVGLAEDEPLWHLVEHAVGLLGALGHALGDVMVSPTESDL